MNQQRDVVELIPQLFFDKNRSRVKCCPCGKENKDGKFAPYQGYENKGYCHSCGETFLPEVTKVEYHNSQQPAQQKKLIAERQKKIECIPIALFIKQLNNGKHLYSQNHFIQWLGNTERGKFVFDIPTIQALIERYFLCNSNKDKYKGWVLFPYIDINGNLRDIKAMDYNPFTGKRIKEPFAKCWYLGKEILNNPEANTERCFFGEHLLRGNNNPVKIFESEATATYAAAFYPESICIATGGNNGCRWTEKSKCRVLQGRVVILYPDIDAHAAWVQKAVILKSYGINVHVSQFIKTSAIKFAGQYGIDYSEVVKRKCDLRDILQYQVLSDFLKPEASKTEQAPSIQEIGVSHIDSSEPIYNGSTSEKSKAESWDKDIADLENYFYSALFPNVNIQLVQGTTIQSIQGFLQSHFATLKRNNGNPTFLPHLNRLIKLKEIHQSGFYK